MAHRRPIAPCNILANPRSTVTEDRALFAPTAALAASQHRDPLGSDSEMGQLHRDHVMMDLEDNFHNAFDRNALRLHFVTVASDVSLVSEEPAPPRRQ
ncbi:hypothetical protein P692DRAFT_20826006 [Suillus brevipes Sb2]|nr:hypothetical protein P692DRAFT_20826006 [Suillus brevipes Sb2]